MKRLLLLFFALVFSSGLFADRLILVHYDSPDEAGEIFKREGVMVNYYNDDFLIATIHGNVLPGFDFVMLTRDAWKPGHAYHLVWPRESAEAYKKRISGISTILSEGRDYLILETSYRFAKEIVPPLEHGIVALQNIQARLPQWKSISKTEIVSNPLITDMLPQVDGDLIQENVQHLQDYGTRNCFEPESVQAQNWIKEEFEALGLDVELHSFSVWGEDVSDNVIATKTGITYPDEYVVIGAHYDSYSWSGDAPGADDNASGTSGVLEVARILSQYDFDRSIIFAAWSGEEYGLYGSGAWASQAASNGMNILGYFNMDMIGYLHQGDEIHTDMIAPSSAQDLVDFYTTTVETYLPGFEVEEGMLSGGDSDHTSFNNNGFMGIFPFEDVQNYSPYIHTDEDIVGLSFNSKEMARTFTQAMVASVSSRSGILGYTGVNENPDATGFSIFPNPSDGIFHVYAKNPELNRIEILDITGKTIQTSEKNNETFDLSSHPEGVYFVRLMGPQEIYTNKIIIR
ncbi:MAG: M28 family peptidase [Bacteroidota bacterium]|nr:M28 family peptidase [Bacteroidota bacterium]